MTADDAVRALQSRVDELEKAIDPVLFAEHPHMEAALRELWRVRHLEADDPEDLPVPANADKRFDEMDGG